MRSGVRRSGLVCGARGRMPVKDDRDRGVTVSKLDPSSALTLGRALVVAGGLLVPLTLLQAREGAEVVSLVLGSVILALVVLVVLLRGILRRWRTATAPRRSSRPARGWVCLNTVVLVGALAVLGANQLLFVGLGHDGAHRACARADVAPYGIDPTVGYEAQWSFVPPTLTCHYSSDDGDPGKNFTADLFPAGASTFWTGLTALACSVTAGLLLRSTCKASETTPADLQRDTASL